MSLGAWSDGVQGYETEVFDDGRTVKEFRQDSDDTWTSQRFCLTLLELWDRSKISASPEAGPDAGQVGEVKQSPSDEAETSRGNLESRLMYKQIIAGNDL